MEKSADKICKLCGSEVEIAEHIVSNCSKKAQSWLKNDSYGMEISILDAQKVTAKAPKAVIGFINAIDDILGFT